MTPTLRIAAPIAAAVVASAVLAGFAGAAGGKGLPVPPESYGAGVSSPGGETRFTTLATGDRTLLVETAVDGGAVERTRPIADRLAVPVVAYDGSASGLSAAGRTLVLIRPRRGFPRATTSFALVDPGRLRIERRIVLDGDFSFDAISPDGETMYLIEYVNPRSPSAYQVRAFDLGRDRLHPDPIIDPRVAPVTMGGAPQTRATSPDGVWAYTLYDTLDRGRPPFIHALDTATATAACILLEDGIVNRGRLARMRLEPSRDGATLAVVDGAEPVAVVDAETFEVEAPEVAGASAAADAGPRLERLGLAALGIAGLGGTAVAILRRRRRGGEDWDPVA